MQILGTGHYLFQNLLYVMYLMEFSLIFVFEKYRCAATYPDRPGHWSTF